MWLSAYRYHEIHPYVKSLFLFIPSLRYRISYFATLVPLHSGRSQEFIFFIIRGANHANLYKNLIKIQIFNVNLRAIGGPGPCPPPCLRPCLHS